jgi:hypothetical protein
VAAIKGFRNFSVPRLFSCIYYIPLEGLDLSTLIYVIQMKYLKFYSREMSLKSEIDFSELSYDILYACMV